MWREKVTASSLIPCFSVIIPVYNDWVPLEQCLKSLSQQRDAPEFEVIVVDDGSHNGVPGWIQQWNRCYALTTIRQAHAGIPSARNAGIKASKGSVLVFTDADCRLESNCLALLGAAVTHFPQNGCFQIHLLGDRSSIVGEAEELRLSALQNHLLQPGNCIRYLNTAGFAIRRERVNVESGLFDPMAFRAEDTLLLSSLMQNGELPLFVAGATIQHAIPLSVIACLKKDLRSAYLEAKTFMRIASTGVRVRMSQWERLRILCSTWKASKHARVAWLLLMCRQLLHRMLGVPWRLLHLCKAFVAAVAAQEKFL